MKFSKAFFVRTLFSARMLFCLILFRFSVHVFHSFGECFAKRSVLCASLIHWIRATGGGIVVVVLRALISQNEINDKNFLFSLSVYLTIFECEFVRATKKRFGFFTGMF